MERMLYGTLDLNLLLVLERLLVRRSVSRAAVDLGLSQPAASRALQRLRDALGDALLVRAGRELVLTERAAQLLGPVSQALEAAGRVFAPPPSFDPATATGTLVIALGDEAQEAFVEPLVRALAASAPGIDLRVRALSAASVEEAGRGVLDLAVGPDLAPLPSVAGRVNTDDLVAKPLYRRRFVVVGARAAWPEAPSLEAYVAADHVIVSFEGGGRGFVDELLAGQGLRRRVAVSVTSFPAAVRLIARTRLLGVMPSEVVDAFGADVVGYAPPFDVPELGMVMWWHPRRTGDARHRWLRGLVAETIGAGRGRS